LRYATPVTCPSRLPARGRRDALKGRSCAPRLSEQAIAHAPEKARISARGLAAVLKIANTRVRSLERLILHQDGLNQRIWSVGRLPQAIVDQALGLRIAFCIFESGEPVE